MQLLHDRATMMRALADTSDPALTHLLSNRMAALSQGDFDLLDHTEILVVEPGDTEHDIIREVGFSPLVEPIDGIRFGKPGFQPFWDWLVSHHGWWEMCISFGGTFAYIILIKDGPSRTPELTVLCDQYADHQPQGRLPKLIAGRGTEARSGNKNKTET